MQVEHDLAWVRLLIGLHGMRARKEVNEIVSGIVEMGAALQYTEDKLTNIMEAAQVRQFQHTLYMGLMQSSRHAEPLTVTPEPVQVMGMVGSLRKRVLLLWQAVEFSRSSERPNLTTLQVCPAWVACLISVPHRR